MLNDTLLDFQTALLSKVWGKYAGEVVNNADPQQMGRVQVRCRAVLGSEPVWALPCVPYAGRGVGFHFIPPQGAGVWVEFAGGDVCAPIWTGCYWAQGDLPAEAASPDVKLIATDTSLIKVDDASGEVLVRSQSQASTTWGTEVTTEVSPSTHTVGASGVVSESTPGKVEVGPSGVTVNNGAFKVL